MEEEIYGIGNADNTKFVCDIYESDFEKFQNEGIIISENDANWNPIGNYANYTLSDDKYYELVKSKSVFKDTN